MDQCWNPYTVHTKAQKTKDPDGWLKYKKLRNKDNLVIRKAEKEYYDLAQDQGNPQAVWKDLNKIIAKGCKEHIGTFQV